MIVAGIGCRRGVSAPEVAAAIRAALDEARLSPDKLACIATAYFKQDEAGIQGASDELGLPLAFIDQPDLEHAATRAVTHSEFVRAHVGVSSVAEAAALAAAGPGSRLYLPRRALGAVTCAIAIGGTLP